MTKEEDEKNYNKIIKKVANEVVIEKRQGSQILRLLNPMTLIDLLQKPEDPVSFAPESEELLEKILKKTKGRIRARRFRQIATYLLIILLQLYLILLSTETWP
jgi:protein phosphatase